MRLNVSAQDIAEGVPGRAPGDPIFIAAERAGLRQVSVYRGGLVAQLPTPAGYVWRGWTFPADVVEFAEAFHRGEPVTPRTVRLR